MSLRSKLIALTVSLVIFPLLIATVLLSILGLDGAETLPVARMVEASRWITSLEAGSASKEGFLTALGSSPPDSLALLPDGRILYPAGASQLAWLGFPEAAPPGGARRNSLWTASFQVPELGTVRAVIRVDLTERNKALDPPAIFMGLFLLALLTGDILIARSLSKAFGSLDASARLIAAGNLEKSVERPRDPDAARLADSLDFLRASLKEEEAKRSRLLMGISHDFRTPIALIRGYAESLEGGVARDEEARSRYLSVIRAKTEELDELVEELLDYARTATDQRRGGSEPRDIHAFLLGLAREFREDAELGERRFVLRDRAERPVMRAFDERLARRAFENLFSNAMRYTNAGGAIELELDCPDDRLFVATMSDDGIGIPEEELKRVFEPLYRGRNTAGRKGQGLGLSVVKSVMDGMGWEIRIGSGPGGGTRCSVLMPRG